MKFNSKAMFPAISFAIFSAVALPTGAYSQTLPDAAINRPSQPIKGQYIVVFKDSVKDVDREVANLNRGQSMRVLHVYKNAIKGFAAQIPDAAVNALRRNPNIDYIEQDMSVSVNDYQSPTTWGLARIDQNSRPLDDSYIYDKNGTGVTAYIIDTGILKNHTDFGTRVGAGYSAIADVNGTEDCNGHGTHVAGTVGGSRWGVAKNVTLIPVRVLGCTGSGSWSGVISGIDWVINHHVSGPAVANMSLGGGLSSSINSAVDRGISDGIVFAVAAGNSNADACRSSPSSTPSAITVGATTNSDSRASYSNWGSCLDVFAPGSSITSGWYTSTTSTNTISGTSMASPHVAGVAALILQQNPNFTPADVANAIVNSSTKNVVASAGTNSPNRLLRAPSAAIAPPTVSTGSVSNRKTTSATVGATLRTVGSSAATYGFCYTAAANIDPLWAQTPAAGVICFDVGNRIPNSTSVSYSRNFTGLTTLTTYYVRPFARSADGVTYGLKTSFKTL